MWLFALFSVSTVLNILLQKALRPKVQKRGPGELKHPMAELGVPIPVAFGTVRLEAPNAVWWGVERAEDRGNGSWDYQVAAQLALCHGPVDRVTRIWVGEKLTTPVVDLSNARGSIGKKQNVAGVLAASTISEFPTAPTPGAVYISAPTTGFTDANSGPLAQYVPANQKNTKLLYNPYAKGAPIPAGWFIVFSNDLSKYPGGTYSDNYWYQTAPTTTPHNFAPLGTWALRSWCVSVLQPNVGDICTIDGVKKQWNGTTWEVTAGKDYSVFGLDMAQDDIRVRGRINFHYGNIGQVVDPDLAVIAFGDNYANPVTTPGYGGLCYAGCFGPYVTPHPFEWGESPQIPSMVFEVARLPFGPDDSNVLYQDPIADPNTYTGLTGDSTTTQLAATIYDANPAHVIYDILTNTQWGMAKPASDIDNHSFFSAAKILSGEGLGISMLLDTQQGWDDTIDDVLKVIDGILFDDVVTGKTTLRLLRSVRASFGQYQDTWYSNTTWPTFSETEIVGDVDFTRGGADEVVTDCRVQFTNRFSGYSQDVASDPSVVNHQYLGARNSMQSVYQAVTNRRAATTLSARDLKTLGYPRARGKFSVNRGAWKLNLGDRFVLNWTALGISNLVCRVGEIDYGNFDDAQIEISFIQDMFQVAVASFAEPDDGWTDPAKVDPVAPSAVALLEMPFDLSGNGPRRTFMKLAARGSDATTGLRLWSGKGSLTQIGSLPYAPTGILQAALDLEEYTASASIQGVTDGQMITSTGGSVGGKNLALVEDEIIAWDSHSPNADGTVTFTGILRGVLDTIPAEHGIGARVWVLKDFVVREAAAAGGDIGERDAFQAYNGQGEITLPESPSITGEFSSRQFRPLPPGRFRVGASADLPDSIEDRVVVGSLPVTWSNRNRITQVPGVVAQDATPITPESGQITDIRLSQGMAGMFELVDGNGTAFPFDVPVTIGVVANWATVKGVPLFYLAVGAGAWADTSLADPGGTNTSYVGINVATLQVEQIPSPLASAWITLYRVNFSGSGASRAVTVNDWRTDDPIYIETMAGTENAGSVDPADFGVAPSGVRPYRARLVAVRDGMDSRASRDTGDLLAAGWGVNWGMFWGGN